MMCVSLICVMSVLRLLTTVAAQNFYISKQCKAMYSEGSVAKPCTLCAGCVKAFDEQSGVSRDQCAALLFFRAYFAVIARTTPFMFASVGGGRTVCAMKQFCHSNTNFTCAHSRPAQGWQQERVRLLSDCKCKCDSTHFGQTCDQTIPPHLSIDSFADVQNLVYVPIIYATDYATIYVYFYTPGVELSVELRTETQSLKYNAASCKRNVVQLKDLCRTLFDDGGVRNYMEVCEGGPTFEEHKGNAVCAVIINIAFAKDKLKAGNEKKFIVDDNDGSKSKSDAKVVAKIEQVSVTVFNKIPNLNEGSRVLLSTVFGITVIYRGKSSFEDCPVFVTIPQYGKKTESAPSFPRSQEISLTNLVVLEKVPECNNLGDPVTNWFLWDCEVNHDEKHDNPYYKMFETPTLSFDSFTLAYGKYKVKSVVRFTQRHLDKAFSYCYFEIIPIPLQPLLFGGSLRYIYYKSNLNLISNILVDPNYPLNDQPQLKREWYCNDTNDRLCARISGSETNVTKSGPFQPGKSYTFTMSVQSPRLPLESCHQTIIVSKDPIPNLLIDCLRNCGGKGFKSDTREVFYFKVLKSYQTSKEVKGNDIYNWTYSMGNTSFIDVVDIRQQEVTPSWILIINDNTLKDNHEYTFKVTGGGESSGEAQITVHMFKYTDNFRCTINPTSGIAGQTKFSIECNKAHFERNRQLSLTIYFYDKFNKSDEIGRLLGSNYIELIEDIILTRGTVMVVATNMFGQFQKTYVNVSLTFPNLTAEFLTESLLALESLSENEGYSQKLSYISSLCDVLNQDLSIKEQYMERFLEMINEEDSIDLVHLELLLSATQSVLCNADNCTRAEMSNRAYQLLGNILTDVSNKLVKELQRTAGSVSDLPSTKVKLLYTSLIKCSGVFLSVQNKELVDKDALTVDYNVYNLHKVGNMKILNSLDNVNQALALRNIPFIKQTTVRTKLVETWMKQDKPRYFTQGTKGNHSGSYLIVTPSLANTLRKSSNHIVIYVMAFKNNPYWWSQTQDVSTQVVSVSVGYTRDYKTYKAIKYFKYPIDIYLKKNNNPNTTVTGVVAQPDPNNDDNDLAVSVHQIYTLKGEKVALKFVDLGENDVFKVSVTKNRRPDYAMVLAGILVNYSSPWYSSPKSIKVIEDDDVVFVGILPGDSVPVNATRSYKFELQSARCQVWYDFLWDASGCSLGLNSSQDFLHCRCTHLSSIAGFIGVPINTINPLKDYTLFLTIPDNPYVFAFILTILFIYILLLVWSYVANKRDLLRTSLIVLEDNISTDYHGYLVIVFTGFRLYAGTTSHIGIILHGSHASSRSHILKSTSRPTLCRDTDDWFLLYAPKKLGIISSVQLWSDHSGTSPNWFCDRIHVHDFNLNKDYSFLIGKWFGVTQLGTRVESFARPIALENVDYVVDFFLTNIVSGLRESHMWISILAKHPRSPMTRAQRLSVAMVALVTILLGCILFYEAALPEDEDLPEYSMSTREALISLYTMCISIAVTAVVFFAFSKSYTYQQTAPECVEMAAKVSRRSARKVTASHLQVDRTDTLRQRKRAKRGYKYYIKKAILSMRQEHFYPVRAGAGGKRGEEENKIIVHKVRLILAWILCACVIFVFCFFTVWLGLKIGKNKSLLWLTTIGMTLMEDSFLMDPIKIVFIALVFGMVQTQLCDLYVYDPQIYNIRKSLTRHLNRDQHIHKMRLKPLYKPVPVERLQDLHDQQTVVTKWWTIIDIFDIFFSVIVIFCIIERYIHSDLFHTNSAFTNVVFKQIQPYRNLVPSPVVHNVSTYSVFLQDSVFSTIYCTQWYNQQQLTDKNESFAETGWAKTMTHRMIGVPRLRQIRVHQEACDLPSALKNLTSYCNVPYSGGTEDTEFYSAQWKNYTTEFVDVVFEKSPWIYTFADQVSSYGVAGTYAQTGELFHGAGYIAELTRTRRKSAGTLINLVDLDWLDMRTRIVFFEMSAYNANNNLFTSITFVVEHLEDSLILASKTVRSFAFEQENVLLEVIFFFYSVLILIKLLMVLNTIGPQVFFTSFWTLYDLCFVLVGLIYFIGYRIVIEVFSGSIKEFQRSEKEEFFPFSSIFFAKKLNGVVMSLMFIFATARSLRLLKYESSIIYIKYRHTLYFSWPQILCVTCILLFFMLSYQWVLEYLVNCLYPLRTSHLLLHKMNFRKLQLATVTPNTMFFIYIPCCFSCMGLVFYIMVLTESYSRANSVYIQILQDRER